MLTPQKKGTSRRGTTPPPQKKDVFVSLNSIQLQENNTIRHRAQVNEVPF